MKSARVTGLKNECKVSFSEAFFVIVEQHEASQRFTSDSGVLMYHTNLMIMSYRAEEL